MSRSSKEGGILPELLGTLTDLCLLQHEFGSAVCNSPELVTPATDLCCLASVCPISSVEAWHKVFSAWNALQYRGLDPGQKPWQLKHEEVPDVEPFPSGHQQQGVMILTCLSLIIQKIQRQVTVL